MKQILQNNQKRLIPFAVITFVLSVITIIIMRHDGIKSMAVCLILCIATAFAASFKKIKMDIKWAILIQITVSLIYLFYVPKKLYERTELVTNDMSLLLEGTLFLNICIILIAFFILLFVSQRTSVAFGTTGIIMLLLTIINFYTYTFRGKGLSILDFTEYKTAVTVMGGYTYTVTPELWKTILYYLAFIVIGFRIDTKVKGKKYHIIITAFSALALTGTILCYKYLGPWDNVAIKGEKGNIIAGENAYGLYYYLYLTNDAYKMERPINYSDTTLTSIAKEAEEQYETYEHFASSVEHPNIIIIMNEAWSDLRVLGNLETNESFSPFIDSLDENAIKGYAYVNIQGGMTADSEFECLTGDSMALLNTAAIPYQMQVKHDLSSLPKILEQNGYTSLAIHPSSALNWNRNTVYEYMGFDDFISIDDFETECDYIGGHVTDESNYQEIITRFEEKDESRPIFIFNVTIQNHSGYYDQTPITVYTTEIGQTKDVSYNDVSEYLSLMKLSDTAFSNLVDYFSSCDEPTIICMFGDHQPILNNDFYDKIFEGQSLSESQKKEKQYITPYVIWANYDADFPEYGDVNASDLGAIICELTGNEMPSYYKFLLNSMKEVPAFNIYSDNLDQYEDFFKDYRVLQYDQLINADYRKDIFELSDK